MVIMRIVQREDKVEFELEEVELRLNLNFRWRINLILEVFKIMHYDHSSALPLETDLLYGLDVSF